MASTSVVCFLVVLALAVANVHGSFWCSLFIPGGQCAAARTCPSGNGVPRLCAENQECCLPAGLPACGRNSECVQRGWVNKGFLNRDRICCPVQSPGTITIDRQCFCRMPGF